MSMLYRVNAGRILLDSDHSWIQDENVGGGRIIGECCHFIDTLQFVVTHYQQVFKLVI